jgi:thiol-disulfide isomerase/thioredoxin
MSKKFNLDNPSIVLIYANWCIHCKNFMPVWEQLEQTLDSNSINIHKIESSDEFTKKITISGYPTIYFINKNEVIQYNSSRDYESIKTFIIEKIE